MLVKGQDYDYITRTSLNQGILQTTGFVNETNINLPGIWSLGLLQMDFFYRSKPWYAGQFVRKIIPKIEMPNNAVLFFTTLLNKQKKKLLSVLVRDVDKTFKDITVNLPITANKEINFDFMESFTAELEAQRTAELEAYLIAANLKDYKLTAEEERVLELYNNINFDMYDVVKVFDVANTSSILSRDVVKNSGNTPYLCASSENNSVSSYISYNKNLLDKGNCIFIGGKTFVVSYQEYDFYSNDSHNLALYLKETEKKNRQTQLFLATCIEKSLKHKYSWGDSISNKKIQKDKVNLPVKEDKIDFDLMETIISAVQKLVIKDVVLYSDRKIAATKEVIKDKEKNLCSEK